jgi:hypothetical protein
MLLLWGRSSCLVEGWYCLDLQSSSPINLFLDVGTMLKFTAVHEYGISDAEVLNDIAL